MDRYLFLADPSWTGAFWITFAGFMAAGIWAASRERSMTKGENRDRGSKLVIYFFTFLGLGLAFMLARYVPAARIALPPAPVFATGLALSWIGIALYAWAIVTLGASFRTSVTLLEGQRLITRGPYRILRHPAYTGGILIFTGIGLAIGNWLSFAAASLVVAIGYAWRIKVEEKALRERFGAEFDANRKRTWAVIPLVW